MLFQEAFNKMLDGELMTRAGWDKEGPNSGYVCIMPHMQFIWRILSKPNPNCGNYLPSIADILADDWEILSQSEQLQEAA